MTKKPTKHTSHSTPKKPKDDDAPETEEEIEEGDETETEPEPMSDDPENPAPAQPTEGVKEAAEKAQAAVDEDRGREVPLLETYKAASLQKQADWEKDAKEFFRDEDFAKKRREEMLAEMDKMDLQNRKEQEAMRADAKKREDKADGEIKRKHAEELRHRADELDRAAQALGA